MSKEGKNGHYTSSATSATAFTTTLEVALVALDFAAERALAFTLAGQAATNHLVNALCSMTVNIRCSSRSTGRHFKSEVLDELVELAIGQLAVFN